MCYERTFFDHWAAKRAQRQKEQAKAAPERTKPADTKPVSPLTETRKPKETERESELV